MRNLVNPGRKLVLGAIARQRTVDLDKDLLREIERRLVIAPDERIVPKTKVFIELLPPQIDTSAANSCG